MAEIHINVGIVALQRGFITLETFARRMNDLAAKQAMSIRDLWCVPGALDEAQLAAVLDALSPKAGGDTMLFAPEPPPTQVGKTPPSRGPQMPLGTATAPTHASVADTPLPGSAAGGLVPILSQPGSISHLAQPVSPATAPTGGLVGNRYKKLFPLGAGGLGEVTACEDLVLGRTVAVKAGHDKGDIDSYSAKVILAREARIISHLEHPNIIPIYDAGTDSARGPFYVMRQVTDTSLEAILRRRRLGEGDPNTYTLGRLLRYFLQVCNAVDYAHNRGVIHCDIKPANILLGDYGEVLLVDWGLAQSRSHPLGVRGGTLGYMAPEQMDP